MTTTESNGTALALREYPKLTALTGWTGAQIGLMAQTCFPPDANIIEMAWGLYNARRLNLEPLLDQIYFIRYARGGPIEIVVGINGYRAKADESGTYAGSDDPVFEYEDVGQPQGAPSKATVTVWKIVQGMRVPFSASARWEEFYPDHGRQPSKQGEQWRKRPHNQLGVRAESHALRKAFPHQTGQLEVPLPAPQTWVEAARADDGANNSPERTAKLATEYDRVIASNYDDEPRRQQPPTETEQEDPRVRKRAQLSELLAEAKKRGLSGEPPLLGGPDQDPLDAALDYWFKRIENYDLDQQAHRESQRQTTR